MKEKNHTHKWERLGVGSRGFAVYRDIDYPVFVLALFCRCGKFKYKLIQKMES